jgi:hypothetical protein
MDANAQIIKSEGLFSDGWTGPRWRAVYAVPPETRKLELTVWSARRPEVPNGHEIRLETILGHTVETVEPETQLTLSVDVPEPLDGLVYFELKSGFAGPPLGDDIRTLGVVVVSVVFS